MEFELISSAAGAKAPWRSADSMNVTASGRVVEPRTLTPHEEWEINTCLNCKAPECYNCFDAWKNAFGNIRRVSKKKRSGSHA